ncbi:MAG: DnaA N-terminal domain-containing protein, partial [Leptonema sp. (in: bacteria)]
MENHSNYYQASEEILKKYNYKYLANWEECKNSFKNIIPEPFYSHFIRPLYAFYDDNKNVVLYVENEKLQNHIEIRYADIINHIIYDFYKDILSINKIIFFNNKRPQNEQVFKHSSPEYKEKKEVWDLDLFYPSKENFQELN